MALRTPLLLDGDFGEEQITLGNSDGFKVGYGVSITDDRGGGFHTAVGTILWQKEQHLWRQCAHGGAIISFLGMRALQPLSLLSVGYHLENARIENLTVDGKPGKIIRISMGCRGAGIFLYRGATIQRYKNCAIKNYHGDGISFQQKPVCPQSEKLQPARAIPTWGLHPGSGQSAPHHPQLPLGKQRSHWASSCAGA